MLVSAVTVALAPLAPLNPISEQYVLHKYYEIQVQEERFTLLRIHAHTNSDAAGAKFVTAENRGLLLCYK